MKDACGRTIDYLRLSLTEHCNYRCRYCMPSGNASVQSRENCLTVAECEEIAQACVELGIRKIRLTGGEPLVRPELLAICRALRNILKSKELCLTTNGSLLQDMASSLREAGLDRLNISLDSLRPERFREITRVGSLADVLDGLSAAEEAGFQDIKLDIVLIGGFNDDEIPDFVRLTKQKNWEVRFIELMPVGVCTHWEKKCFIPADIVLQKMPELQEISAQGVARRYRLPGAAGTVGLITPLSFDFCGECRRIRITADGRLKGCLHSREEIPLRGLHGAALRDAIRQGILSKPERHSLTQRSSDTPRNMNQIGG